MRIYTHLVFDNLIDYLPPEYELSSSSIVDELYWLIVDHYHQEPYYKLYRAEEKLIETLEIQTSFFWDIVVLNLSH